MTSSTLAINSNGMLQVLGLKDHNSVIQNDATVTLISFVNRATGEAVTGITLPLAVTYIAASAGNYEAQIPHDTSVVVDDMYSMTVRAILASSARREWTETVRVLKATA